MNQKKCGFLLALLSLSVLFGGELSAQEPPPSSLASAAQALTLVQASMCASLKEGSACNSGAVFPVSQGRVLCFSAFEPVPRRTSIIHSWFHRDVLIIRQKLTLSPPRWSTYSAIELRESDKGPWRVEIVDEDARLLQVLRFSITD
jgi:hypothetical protein